MKDDVVKTYQRTRYEGAQPRTAAAPVQMAPKLSSAELIKQAQELRLAGRYQGRSPAFQRKQNAKEAAAWEAAERRYTRGVRPSESVGLSTTVGDALGEAIRRKLEQGYFD